MRHAVFNWKNLSQLGSKAERLMAMKGAIDIYFKRPLIARGDIVLPPEQAKALESMGVKLTGPDNTPNTGNRQTVVSDTFMNAPLQDFGYMDLFDFVDMRNVSNDTFEILDATNAITFTQRKKGEDAKIYEVSDTKATVKYMDFAAGLSFYDAWFQFQQYYKFDDATAQARRKYFDKMANVHYTLFTSLGAGINQAFNGTDSQTIDDSCTQIISDVKDKGYFETENVQFMVLASNNLRRRLSKAIWPFTINPNDTTAQGPVHNISALITSWHIPASTYYVILPGNKLKRGIWKDLTVESDRDILKSAEDFVWNGQYNAAIGDSQQVRRPALV